MESVRIALGLFRRSVRALGSLLVSLVVAALLVVVAFGPALGPLARQLADSDEHACACGMKPGTCGCPACARLLAGDDAFHLPSRVDVLGSCDDHRHAPLPSGLPLALVPPGARIASSPRAPNLVIIPHRVWVPDAHEAPPTPPPRLASV